MDDIYFGWRSTVSKERQEEIKKIFKTLTAEQAKAVEEWVEEEGNRRFDDGYESGAEEYSDR